MARGIYRRAKSYFGNALYARLDKFNTDRASRNAARRYSIKNFHPVSNIDDPSIPATFFELMTRDEPSFVSRLGGTEFESAASYLINQDKYISSGLCHCHMGLVQQYSGYFDFEHDNQRFIRYLELLINSYEVADAVTYAGPVLRENTDSNSFPQAQYNIMKKVALNKPLIRYSFIETVRPFLESFTEWGADRKLLIVSPFSESLRIQYNKKDNLIPGYRFPNFDLETVTTPITYSTWDDTKDSLHVVTNNWFEELERMKEAIAAKTFDIAWLSCASYAGPLGAFIRNELGRHAIYLGGVLNPIFNIYGERYDVPHYKGLSNPKTQIDPVENSMIEHISAGRDTPSEAIRAYFGTRKESL